MTALCWGKGNCEHPARLMWSFPTHLPLLGGFATPSLFHFLLHKNRAQTFSLASLLRAETPCRETPYPPGMRTLHATCSKHTLQLLCCSAHITDTSLPNAHAWTRGKDLPWCARALAPLPLHILVLGCALLEHPCRTSRLIWHCFPTTQKHMLDVLSAHKRARIIHAW